jgi:hypothetical protein
MRLHLFPSSTSCSSTATSTLALLTLSSKSLENARRSSNITLLQYWLTLTDFNPEGDVATRDVFLFPPRANYPSRRNEFKFNFRSHVTVGVFDKAFIKACENAGISIIDVATQSLRKTSWGYHFKAGADTASQQVDGRLATVGLIATYRADQIAEINRLEAIGKDFSFIDKYRGLDIKDPVISRMEKTNGTLQSFKTQFLET